MTPEMIILLMLLIAVTLYAVLGGADFGAGVWEFNTALQSTEKQRALLYRAIGPVWEANHVWLIFALVILLSAFPIAFAALFQALWLPLLLALLGIVFRGAGFAFRSYAAGAVRQQELWGVVFALASTAAPFFLGACAGAIASGQLPVTATGDFEGNYLTDWITPLSIFTSFFAVGMCAYLAAVYLALEASNEQKNSELVALWRQRALSTGIWMGILAVVGLVLVSIEAQQLWEGFCRRAWPVVGLSILTGALSLVALWKWHFISAVVGAAVTVATVLCGWGIAQYPMIIAPAVSVELAKGPDTVLRMLAWSIAAGAVILLPSLAYLFYLFKFKGKHSASN